MDLDELERLLKAATAGPWQLDSSFQDEELLAVKYVSADGMNFYIADEVGGRRKGENFEDESECIANAALIAALRNNAEELIRDARRYRKLLMEVSRKWPDETRHETALRYIRQAETPVGGPEDAKQDAIAQEGKG